MPNQVIFMDSFEHMATLEDVRRKWTSTGIQNPIVTNGRNGKGANITTWHGPLTKSFPTSYANLYAGVAYKTLGFGNNPITFSNTFGQRAGLYHLGDGRFCVQGWDPAIYGGYIYSDPFEYVLHTNVWYYLEFSASFGPTDVTCEFRVNEESFGTKNLTYASKSVYEANMVTYTGSGNSLDTFIDDIYIASDKFYGDVIIDYIKPNGNTAYSQWTPSSAGADHWDLVNDLVPNNDTDYVETDVNNNEDRYEMEDIGLIGEVFAIQGVCYVKKINPGTGKIKLLYEVNGSTDESYTIYPSANDYQYFLDVRNTAPGGISWVGSLVNILKYGVRRVL